MSQYIINDSNNCLNTTNSFNSNMWNNCTFADDRSQLLTWLSPLEPSLRHCDIRDRRVNDIGEWLIQTEEFRRWHGFGGEGESDKAVLFCYGDPGVGKTFISSLVVDRLCHQARRQNGAVSCFYFDFAARKEQSAASMLGSLMKQMVNGMERIPEEILRVFQEHKMMLGGCRPQLVDIVKMLQIIASSQPTFICIDALDECAGGERSRILDSLKEVLGKSPGLRIFVTGRPHVRAEVERRLHGQVRSVSLTPTRGDITRYLRVRLGHDETPDAMDESLKADILEEIPEIISEMFLLVSLSVEAILQESTIYRRRERLSQITSGLGLGDAYSATIERIKAQGGDKSRLGMATLMWISHAERPLKADELCHALAVELGSTDFNSDNAPSMSTLVSCCQGLVTVDKEGSTVRLIHFTLQEYLSIRKDIFGTPNATIAEICLTYLNSQQVKAISVHPYPATTVTYFLEYCSLYWGAHAKRELSSHARSLALALFKQYNNHISPKLLLVKHRYLGFDDFDDYMVFPFSGLDCASFFGIGNLVTALIEMKCYDINEGSFWGYTPLAWAAEYGHEEVVKILLDHEEVNPNKLDHFGATPLWQAALRGHEGVVKILLDHEEVDPDTPNSEGRTPLSYAAYWGHDGVAKILLEREEVDPDKPDEGGRTPLSYAACNGYDRVVKRLLGLEGVDPDRLDSLSRTPLSYAAWRGNEGVVKILLGREEVNPHKPDYAGRTPAAYAAQRGHKEVVKILLACEGADPDKLETWDATLLWNAASGGDEEAAKILLGRQEVNPDWPDNDGRTLLTHAALTGHERMIKLLLEHEEVNPDKPDNWRQTPLSHAAQNGHEGAVNILLGREEVDPDTPDIWGRTPLSYAAYRGHEGAVKMLLGREAVDPDKSDQDGKTPLSYAAQHGHEGVVKALLGREDVNPAKPSILGQTPLMHATRRGHKKVIALLQPHDQIIAPSASQVQGDTT